MKEKESQSPESRSSVPYVYQAFDTREDAVVAVRRFWESTYDPPQFKQFTNEDFEEKLTWGTVRTSIRFDPDEKDKWIVMYMGNHVPLPPLVLDYFDELANQSNNPQE